MSRGILIKRISKYSKIEKVISREDIQLLSKSCRSIKTAENLESSNTMCSTLNGEKFGEWHNFAVQPNRGRIKGTSQLMDEAAFTIIEQGNRNIVGEWIVRALSRQRDFL